MNEAIKQVSINVQPVKYNSTKYWEGSITRALEARKTHSKEDRWSDIEDYWNHEGDAFEEDLPSFNMLYMYLRALVPSVIFRRPSVINTPRQRGFDTQLEQLYFPLASIYDSIDSLLMDEMEAADVFKDSVLFASLYNMAPVEIGMDFPELPDLQGNDLLSQSLRNQGGFEKPEGVVDRSRRQSLPWIDLINPRQFICDGSKWQQRN